jgi:hypothetical protein
MEAFIEALTEWFKKIGKVGGTGLIIFFIAHLL